MTIDPRQASELAHRRVALDLALINTGHGALVNQQGWNQPQNWDAVAAAALTEGVAGECAGGAQGDGLTTLAELLAPHVRRLTLMNMRRLMVLGRCTEALEVAGVRVLGFKGLITAAATRPDPMTRPAADIDLLVDARDLVACHGALLELGASLGERYPAPSHSRSFRFFTQKCQEIGYAVSGTGIDLHWQLGFTRALLPTAAEALNRAESVTVGARKLWGLEPQDALVHGALHWRYEQHRGFKYVLDLLGMSRGMTGLEHLAPAVTTSLAMADFLASEAWDQPDHPMWAARLAPDGNGRRRTALDRAKPSNSRLLDRLRAVQIQMATTPGLADRLDIPVRSIAGPWARAVGARQRGGSPGSP